MVVVFVRDSDDFDGGGDGDFVRFTDLYIDCTACIAHRLPVPIIAQVLFTPGVTLGDN